jgi:catechol 2,3-dioxygenase-like lactoylglutathione lyase family enzyme
MTMTAIAGRRGISGYAVRYHLRNAAQKLGLESTRELRQWPGFPTDSVRSTGGSSVISERSGDEILQLGPLGQVSMLTRSAKDAEAWYRDTLRLPHVFTFGDLVFFDCGGVRLFIREVPDAEWRPSSTLYFLVPDIATAHKALLARGVSFSGAPHMIFRDEESGTEEWMAFFADPDGNTLAVTARVPGASAG